MVANSKKKHWGQIMGGIKITIDDLGAAVKANITATFDITANDKDRVGADVAGIRSQLTFLVIMLVSSTRLTEGLTCAYTHTHKCTYRYTGKSGSKIDHIAQ